MLEFCKIYKYIIVSDNHITLAQAGRLFLTEAEVPDLSKPFSTPTVSPALGSAGKATVITARGQATPANAGNAGMDATPGAGGEENAASERPGPETAPGKERAASVIDQAGAWLTINEMMKKYKIPKEKKNAIKQKLQRFKSKHSLNPNVWREMANAPRQSERTLFFEPAIKHLFE